MINTIKNISLDDVYWFLKLGKPKYKITTNELISNLGMYIKQPVFFLSTGRCGTKWFTELLRTNKQNAVFHSPKPPLDRQSKIAYKLYTENDFENIQNDCQSLLKELFLSNREQHLRYTYKTGKRYIETNNYITFFAPLLVKLFPDAKFIHLTRNPVQFIKSGLSRYYYTGGSEDDKRIIPKDKGQDYWENLSQVGKIAWLWNETNLFIEKFKEKYNPNYYHFNFNQLTIKSVVELMNFLETDISEKKIKKFLPQKINVQTKVVANTENLIKTKKEEIINICGHLAQKYNYHI